MAGRHNVWRSLLVCLFGTATAVAAAAPMPPVPFADGLWHGDIGSDPQNADVDQCWASTTFDDGTTLTLKARKPGGWSLQVSNPGWHLPPSHQYDAVALVDFYPRLRLVVETKSQTLLEIADIDRIALLAQIENGHTMDLTSEGLREKFVLEGSAKVIQRLRDCVAQ